MGQRLNIEIHRNGELLANCYYHWSAYTQDSITLVKQIINADDMDQYAFQHNRDIAYAVYLLMQTGAALTKPELSYVDEPSPILDFFAHCANRDNGLIAVSPDEMRETRNWEEARVTIDIGTKEIDFGVLIDYDYFDSEEKLEYNEEVNILDIDPHHIPFDRFNEFAYYFTEVEGKHFRCADGNVYIAIY